MGNKGLILIISLLLINCVNAVPMINWSNPSPVDEYETPDTSVKYNLTFNVSQIDTFTYRFNDSNFTIYNESLVFAMNFDNNDLIGETATHAKDWSKYGNNGTISGTPTAGGVYGGYLNCMGNNDGVLVPDDDSIDFGTNEDITISFWVKYTATATSEIIEKQDGGTFYQIRGGATPRVQLDDGVIQEALYTSSTINDGTWHHLAMVRDYGTDIIWYVDGEYDSSKGQDTAGSLAGGTDLKVCYGGSDFDGNMDELRMYNRSLSPQEIYYLYASNMKKYTNDTWSYEIDQEINATTPLDLGTYNLNGSIRDFNGNWNNTINRKLTIIEQLTTLELNYNVSYFDNLYPEKICYTFLDGFQFCFDNATIYGNLAIDGNLEVQGCIKYNCATGCTTLGSCI